MKERWLFLQDEPIEKIHKLAFGLDRQFPDNFDFSEFVIGEARRQSRPEYTLEKCFNGRKMERSTKLVIGQEFFQQQQIRLAFRYDNIWADFMTPLNIENYRAVDRLFVDIFGYNIRNYPWQTTQ